MNIVERLIRAATAGALLALAPLAAHAGPAGTPLPEPDTLALLGLGAVAALALRKSRRK